MEDDDTDAAWRTAISTADPDSISYRGFDLGELVGALDFASTAFLLVRGDPPSEREARVFNGLLVAVADHGISPSQAVTRYTAAGGSPIQASVAAGILTIGDHHGGAGQITAELFTDALAARTDETLREVAGELVAQRREAGERMPGYGHPEHPDGDPRGPLLVDLAYEEGVAGEHVALAEAVEDELAQAMDRPLPLNVNGATAALLLDLGFPPSFARPFIIMSRVPGLIAHALEETERERAWRTVAGGVEYDGPTDRTLDR